MAWALSSIAKPKQGYWPHWAHPVLGTYTRVR
jgi:hypothetical protein